MNDTCGYSVGDQFAAAGGDDFVVDGTGSDTVARLGGHEFAIVLAQKICDRNGRVPFCA